MICFKCDNQTEFHVEERNVFQYFKCEMVEITTPLTICSKCGFYFFANGQVDEMIKRINQKYGK